MKQHQMSQEEAQKKFHEWGVLLLLDVPQGIEFGIDNTSWKVGDKFKGVKLIPPGAHFVHYSLKNEDHKFKLGFFIHIGKKKRVWVRKWNPEKEDFLSLPTSEEEERYVMGVNAYQFDEFLGPYPMDRLQIWKECSNFITESVLDTLNPIERKVHQIEEEYRNQNYTSSQQQNKIDSLVMEFIAASNQQSGETQESQQTQQQPLNNIQQQEMKISQGSQMEEEQQEEEIMLNKPQLQQNGEEMRDETQHTEQSANKTQCTNNNRSMGDIKNEIIASGQQEDFRVMAGTIYYTDLPKVKSSYGKKGSDLTSFNLDKSPILKNYIQNRQKIGREHLLKKKINATEVEIKQVEEEERLFIFGEFQYSFVMLLLLEDFESFEHWKNVFSILISSDSFMDESPDFYIEFIPVLYNLLKQFPRDFFIDSISKDNFLKTLLSDFIVVTSQSSNKKLSQRSLRLQMLLEEFFLFFPKKTIVQTDEGDYKFNQEDDQDAPQIVDDEHPVYF